jgi:Spy/CpxP family protein refolding chaperone
VNYWKVILATVVIFGAGVFTGGLLVNYVDHPHHGNPHRPQAGAADHPPTNNPAPPVLPEIPMPRIADRMGKQFVQQLNDTLQLTPEQREKIEKIIAAGQEQNREIWTNVAPKMRAVMQEVNQQIRAELTPEQLKPFEELLKQHSSKPTFSERLESIKRLGTNTPSAYKNNGLTPEQQVQKIEAERLRALSNASQFMPPPPPTNAPGI